MLKWVQTFAIATGSATLLGYLITLPFSPARFWSWRLRKHMETIDAIDSDRFDTQRATLMKRADYLSARVASTYVIPTNWRAVRSAVVVGGFGVGFIASWVETWRRGLLNWQDFSSDPITNFYVLPFALLYWALDVHGLFLVFRHTRWERLRYVSEGCPEDFNHRYMPFGASMTAALTGRWPRREKRKRVKLRRKQLRVYKNMPPGIRPHSVIVQILFIVRDATRIAKGWVGHRIGLAVAWVRSLGRT